MLNDVLVVLPVLDRKMGEGCLASMHKGSAFGIPLDRVLVIDNTRDGTVPLFSEPPDERGPAKVTQYYRDPDDHNIGVARAWNRGAQAVLERDIEYLVICSSVMRFGPELHTNWLREMRAVWGSPVIEAMGHSWHLIAFHRSVLEQVGLFDPNFYPAYLEALDYGLRLRLVGLERAWQRPWINAMSLGHGMHVDQASSPEVAKVSCPYEPLDAYYREKWGGTKGEETFTYPFGDKPRDYFDERPIPELAAKYGLQVWW